MLIYLKACLVMYWISLALWLSMLVSGAIAAVNVFGAVPDMDAGRIMADVFVTTAFVRFVVVPLSVITLLLQVTVFGLPWRTPAGITRTLGMLGAAAIFAFYAFAVTPPLNRQIRQYRDATESGDVTAAQAHHAEVRRLHGRAELTQQLELVLVLVAIGASAAAFASLPSPPALQTPRLAQRP